jgi:hypothetical protein
MEGAIVGEAEGANEIEGLGVGRTVGWDVNLIDGELVGAREGLLEGT